MQDRFKFRIAVFERYKTEEWEFINFIENSDKVGVLTSGNVIQANVQGLIIHLSREKTPENVYRTMEAMQCTGLKDKNGKLIYEGDIVGGIYGNLYIHYCDSCKQFQLKAKDIGCTACEGDIHWCELVESEDENELEVIGNIYQNPELLED